MKPWPLYLLVCLLPAMAQDKPSPPAPAPQAPASPAAETAKQDGGVPAAAVKFQGSVTGTVETIDDSKKRFKLKITKATPGAKSGAADAQTLVTRVVEVSAGGQRDALGKYVHTAEHITWITELKPGASVTLDVRYSGYRNRLKLTTLPKPPKPGVQPPP